MHAYISIHTYIQYTHVHSNTLYTIHACTYCTTTYIDLSMLATYVPLLFIPFTPSLPPYSVT